MNIFALNRNELKLKKKLNKSNNKSNKRNKKLKINRIYKN